MTGLRYPWSVLGIAPTEDQRAIQKAYATRLRVTRPDEDPRGFQELREARDQAMAERRHLAMAQAADDDEPPVEPPPAEPAPELVKTEAVARDVPRDVGSVVFEPVTPAPVPDVPAADLPEPLVPGADDVEDEPDLAELLEQVGVAHPWRDLAGQWAQVFDAMEQAPLAHHGYNMWLVLQRLMRDIRQRVGPVPDIVAWHGASVAGDRDVLGRYGDILRDFESRFGMLKQDTVLFDYMDEEDARDFTAVLALAAGRQAAPRPAVTGEINVEPFEQRFVDIAWKDDRKMLEFCRKARAADEFPWSFSWVALLFPLPFALYYRLRGVAGLVAILAIANTAFTVMRLRGLDTPFAPFVSTVYLVTAVAVAFNARRIRFQALASVVRKLTDAGRSNAEIEDSVRAWGRPSAAGLLLGLVVLVAAVGARVLAR